jgi:hypothetical protein
VTAADLADTGTMSLITLSDRRQLGRAEYGLPAKREQEESM